MKKKILFLMPYFGCGGVESTLLSLLDLMDRNKYDITLMMLQNKGEFLYKLPENIKISKIKIPEKEKGIFFGKKKVFFLYLKKLQVIKLIKFILYNCSFSLTENRTKNFEYFEMISDSIPSVDGEYDIAIDYFGYATFTTFFLSEKINAKKKVSWIHSIMSRFDPVAFKKYYEKMDTIFACSQMVKEDFENIFPTINTVEVFYNIINPIEIRQKSLKNGGFDDDYSGIRILTVGRICHEKGIDIAARTYNLLREKGYNIRWYIIGSGSKEDIDRIKEIICDKENFIFLGIQDNPYVYMKQCDIYVQPSRFEGYCTTTNEARIIGCPIVMTNVSGANEQINNGENGFIVESDENSIFKAVKTMIDSEDIINKFRINIQKIDCDTRNEIKKIEKLL